MPHTAAMLCSWAPFVYLVGHRSVHGELPMAPDAPSPTRRLTTIHHRILWLRRGRLEIRLPDRSVAVEADTVVYLSPGIDGVLAAPRPARFLQLVFDVAWRQRGPLKHRPEVIAPLAHDVDASLAAFGFPPPPLILDPARARAARTTLAAMRAFSWREPIVHLRVHLALLDLLERWLTPPPLTASGRRSVREQAAAAGVSVRSLYRHHRAAGRPPPARAEAEWADQHALLLLQQGLSIQEIARRLDYTTAGFIRAFRRQHGASPASWRRNRRLAGHSA